MPELKCTVQTCTHNKQFYCDLDAIEVQGDSARKSDELWKLREAKRRFLQQCNRRGVSDKQCRLQSS